MASGAKIFLPVARRGPHLTLVGTSHASDRKAPPTHHHPSLPANGRGLTELGTCTVLHEFCLLTLPEPTTSHWYLVTHCREYAIRCTFSQPSPLDPVGLIDGLAQRPFFSRHELEIKMDRVSHPHDQPQSIVYGRPLLGQRFNQSPGTGRLPASESTPFTHDLHPSSARWQCSSRAGVPKTTLTLTARRNVTNREHVSPKCKNRRHLVLPELCTFGRTDPSHRLPFNTTPRVQRKGRSPPPSSFSWTAEDWRLISQIGMYCLSIRPVTRVIFGGSRLNSILNAMFLIPRLHRR